MKAIELEKVTLCDMQNFKTVFLHLLKRDKLMQPIQMQLSHKQKRFSYSFSDSLKSRLNFEHLRKEDDSPS